MGVSHPCQQGIMFFGWRVGCHFSIILNIENTISDSSGGWLGPLMCVDIWIIINDGILSPSVWLNCLFDEQKASQIRGCLCFQTVPSLARDIFMVPCVQVCCSAELRAGPREGVNSVNRDNGGLLMVHWHLNYHSYFGSNKENQHPCYCKILQFLVYSWECSMFKGSFYDFWKY